MKNQTIDLSLKVQIREDDIRKIVKNSMKLMFTTEIQLTSDGIRLTMGRSVDDFDVPLVKFKINNNTEFNGVYELTIKNIIEGLKLYLHDTKSMTTIIDDDNNLILDFENMIDIEEIEEIVEYSLFGKLL